MSTFLLIHTPVICTRVGLSSLAVAACRRTLAPPAIGTRRAPLLLVIRRVGKPAVFAPAQAQEQRKVQRKPDGDKANDAVRTRVCGRKSFQPSGWDNQRRSSTRTGPAPATAPTGKPRSDPHVVFLSTNTFAHEFSRSEREAHTADRSNGAINHALSFIVRVFTASG